jgi:hypothetical protein
MDSFEQVLMVPLVAVLAGIITVTALWLYGARKWRGVPVEHHLAPRPAAKSLHRAPVRARARA